MKREHCKRGHLFAGDNIIMARSVAAMRSASARLAKICDLADKPVVTRKAFRVVVDPIAAAIFGGRK